MPLNEVKRDIEGKPVEKTGVDEPGNNSGIWLFTDRENITHFFEPNFLPPYNTPEKRKIIMEVLKEEWDEKTLSWKPCGQGSMTKPEAIEEIVEEQGVASPMVKQLNKFVGDVLAQAQEACCTGLNGQPEKESK